MQLDVEEIQQWLKLMRLHELSQLPLDKFSQNIYAPTQLAYLQSADVSYCDKEI